MLFLAINFRKFPSYAQAWIAQFSINERALISFPYQNHEIIWFARELMKTVSFFQANANFRLHVPLN